MPTPAHVLIVDDDELSREFMRTILRAEGCAVTTAESGGPALDILKSGTVDLVLLDINMPGVDGFEVLTRLKNEGGADASIIMTSGRNDLETVMRCVDLGADSYLLKPVDPVLFVQRVLASLQRRYTKQWKRDRSATQLA
jgi:DNA-binding response OmpR family regulator